MKTNNKTAKSPKATKSLLSIKEFSEMSGIEQSTLRYWDDIGLFTPAHRNMENSYRYYSPEQITLINFIKVLSNLNIPLKAIAKVNENRSPEAILRLMEQQEEILDAQLRRLQISYSTIHTLRGVLQQGIDVPDAEDISPQGFEDLSISLGPVNEPREGLNFYRSFVRYCEYAKENRINLNNPIGGYYESLARFLAAPSVPTRFFSIDPCGNDKRPAGEYLVGYSKGYYDRLENAATRLEEFAAQQNLEVPGPVYVVYLRDEICEKNAADYLAQVSVALERSVDEQ